MRRRLTSWGSNNDRPRVWPRRAAMAAGVSALLLASTGAGVPGGAAALGPIADYQVETDYLPSTPGVTGGAVGAFANPAAWAANGSVEAALWWNDRDFSGDWARNWGLSIGRYLGFALQHQRVTLGERKLDFYDYQIGVAGGDRRHHVGIAWRGAGGDDRTAGRERAVVLGGIVRPIPVLSVGYSGALSVESDARLGIVDLGVRPFGTPLVTAFGDYVLRTGERVEDGRWGAGVELRPWRGIHLGIKFRDDTGGNDYRYTFNFGLTLDGTGFHVLPGYDEDGDRRATHYLYRHDPPHRGIPLRRAIRSLGAPKRYVAVDLEKKVLTYQRDRWFDKTRVAWLDLARHLDEVREEPGAAGVAVNLAGFRTDPALAWELRQKLQSLRSAGKEVIVHGNDFSMSGYYVASVADRLTLDPLGSILMPGLAVYRTYFKSALEKMGIGFEEWRYFTHKTAYETFSRSTMSEADREQIGRFVDVAYERIREDVARSRGLTPEAFDAVVEDDVWLTAALAAERGLVDSTGRWDDVRDWLRRERDGASLGGLPDDPDRRPHPDERWGRPKEIAVVYAIGECAMDEGIRGRATSAHLRKLAKRRDLAAVVFRADSPGGEALPSELVADGIRQVKKNGRPVVVTQGFVAGSGGYWISMDGSRILTTPLTITGSVGVTGGWAWDAGVGEKTGIAADGVMRGSHADLFTGIRFPFIGSVLPVRNLTERERDGVKDRFLELYGDFVRRVAEARGLPEARVRELGEGRIWIGADAIGNGLCDTLGTLDGAVATAKAMAGLDPDDEVILTEFPPRRLFSLPKLAGGLPGIGWLASRLAASIGGSRADPPAPVETAPYDTRYVEAILANPGAPLLLVPPDLLPEDWRSE